MGCATRNLLTSVGATCLAIMSGLMSESSKYKSKSSMSLCVLSMGHAGVRVLGMVSRMQKGDALVLAKTCALQPLKS